MSPFEGSSETTRYQLRLRGAANAILTEMCKELDASPRDVILDALAVFHFAVKATSEGMEVGSFDAQNQRFTAVVTPSLQRLKKRARSLAASSLSRGA